MEVSFLIRKQLNIVIQNSPDYVHMYFTAMPEVLIKKVQLRLITDSFGESFQKVLASMA